MTSTILVCLDIQVLRLGPGRYRDSIWFFFVKVIDHNAFELDLKTARYQRSKTDTNEDS